MLYAVGPTGTLELVFGGILLLLYGIRLITDTMQRDAGAHLRRVLLMLTKYPLAAMGAGIVITLLTQSSSATSSLLIDLVSAQLLPLNAAILTILGTKVGSALVVQLLIFHITDYAFLLVGIGIVAVIKTRNTPKQGVGQGLLGFGLIVLGLAALEAGSKPLADNQLTAQILEALAQAPLILALLGGCLTIVFSSSVASIGVVLVLASNGSLPVGAALAVILGANVGTTTMALLRALSHGTVTGRRLAFINTGTSLALACLALLCLDPLTRLLLWTHLPAGTLVALSHLAFNLVLVAFFAPLTGALARLVVQLVPEQMDSEQSPTVRYLHPEDLASPAIALGQATRETLRMTDIVTEMLNLSIYAFENGRTEIPGRVDELESQLDELNAAIKRYLMMIDEERMSEEQAQRQVALLYLITELETMGDLVDRQWMQMARRKQRRQLVFSDEGWQDLLAYHREITNAVQQAFTAFAVQDALLAETFFARKLEIREMRRTMHLRHLKRLRSGVPPSIESSALHLDLLNTMRGMLTHASTIARVVQESLAGSRMAAVDKVSGATTE